MQIINTIVDYIKLMFSKIRRQRIVLLDTSGSMQEMSIRSNVRVGDRVIMFDTHAHDGGVMKDRKQIATFQLIGRGGTFILPAIEKARAINPNAKVICVSDGWFTDDVRRHPTEIFRDSGMDITFVEVS